MKSFPIIGVQVLLCALAGMSLQLSLDMNAQSKTVSQALDAEETISAYTIYLENPTTENLRAFISTLPEYKAEPKSETLKGTRDILNYVINRADNYFLIDREAQAGDENAIEAIFRLINISDGAYTEVLLSTLGDLIRNHPRQFLFSLAKYFVPSSADEAIGHYATMMDDFYVDRPRARQHEIRMRIRALEGITDKRYERVKLACVRRLKEVLELLND